MFVVTAKQMRKMDKLAQEKYGIPGLILMENAGLRAAEIALKLLKNKRRKNVVIICGPGNNGGDGFVVARHLFNNKLRVKVFILSAVGSLKGDSLTNCLILKKQRISICEIRKDDDLKKIRMSLKGASLAIDAIFGIGLNKKVEGVFEKTIELLNDSGIAVLSVDIPSGLNADTGEVLGVCVKAHTTVTFGASKKGFYKEKGPRMTGGVIIADISLPKKLYIC